MSHEHIILWQKATVSYFRDYEIVICPALLLASKQHDMKR
jgi:hypothetical protein